MLRARVKVLVARRARVCICAIATLATLLTAPAPVHAFGLPQLGRCVQRPVGLFGGPHCLHRSLSGTYQFLQGTGPQPGFSAPTGAAILETASHTRITCGAGELSGEWRAGELGFDQSEPAAAVSMAFGGCRDPAGATCETSPSAPGEIATSSALVGLLGFAPAPESRIEVGLGLSPEEPSTTVLGFTCGGPSEPGTPEVWTLEGAVIGRIYPLEEMTTSFKLIFRALGAHQFPERFSGGPADALTATRASANGTTSETVGLTLRGVGLTRTIEVRNEEALEILARAL